MQFRKLRKVTSKIVTAPVPTEARGQPAKTNGAKGPKPAKDPEKKASIIRNIVKKLGG
jgi:hypothetical protein